MSIYLELIERVENGEPFSVNFEKRTLKVGKDYLIKAGETYTEQDLFGRFNFYSDYTTRVVLHSIHERYRAYKYSLPSERSDNKRRKYFKALSIDELTDEQLIVATKREISQAALEGFILCMVLTGQLTWDDEIMGGKWFYQYKNDPDLVILRSWIETTQN